MPPFLILDKTLPAGGDITFSPRNGFVMRVDCEGFLRCRSTGGEGASGAFERIYCSREPGSADG